VNPLDVKGHLTPQRSRDASHMNHKIVITLAVATLGTANLAVHFVAL
jgi:hypothetical protein